MFHKVLRSWPLVGVLNSGGFSVSYSEVLKFEKCAAVSSTKFDEQFIADNIDHNEDTTYGTKTNFDWNSKTKIYHASANKEGRYFLLPNYWKLLSLMIT